MDPFGQMITLPNIKIMTNKILKINQSKWTTIVKKNISEIINYKLKLN